MRVPDENGILVETLVLRDTSGRMRRFSQQLHDVLSAAKQKMNDMQTNAVWLSDAGEAIIAKINLLQPTIDKQREDLGQYCDFLEKTANDYEAAEERRLADGETVPPNK